MLRYKTKTRPGLVALYDIRPGNGAGQFLQPQSPHGALSSNKIQNGDVLVPAYLSVAVVCQMMVMERFGFEPDMSMEAVQGRLKELEETIRRQILKEMKIKEGAENMRRATNDKKSLAHVRTIVNEANDTLQNLNQELNDVRNYLLMTNDDVTAGATAAVKRPGKTRRSRHSLSSSALRVYLNCGTLYSLAVTVSLHKTMQYRAPCGLRGCKNRLGMHR